MPVNQARPPVVRFGVFEVDLTAREVRKAGMRQKLGGQPFQVLQVLLEHPGEIVTREDLRQRLWPENKFVDYELALKKAVNRLREMLGDSAESPRFIETVPRRGYRFVAPVFEGNGGVQTIQSFPVVGRTATRRRRAIALFTLPAIFLLGTGALLRFTLKAPDLRTGQFVRLTHDGRDKSGNLSDGIPSPVLTDGTRIYFVEHDVGLSNLVQVSAAGGDTLSIPSPFRSVRLAGISPDLTHLLIGDYESPTTADQPFYKFPTVGGSALRLSDFLAHDASWSPNGLSLAYAAGESLSIARADGSTPKKLVTDLGAVWWPRWSPDGKRIRFTVTQPKTQDNTVWEIARDGTHLRQVSRDWDLAGDKCCGSWTPDGKYFVFQSSTWSGTALWAVSEPTLAFPFRESRPVQLVSGPIWASAPSVSGDGKKLFFIGLQPHTESIRYDPKGKHFVPFLPGISPDALDITRDGKWVTYTQYPEGSLWRARSDGTERVRLTSGEVYACRPRWSPDGASIVFFGPSTHGPWKLYMLSASGGTPARLIQGAGNEGDPTWSPDGAKIAFGRLPWMPSAAENPYVYIFEVSSKRLTALPDSEGLFSPRWSRSGRYIAALTADSTKLLMYDFEKRKWRQLAQGSFGNPEWSQDEAYIYAVDPRTMTMIRIRTTSGEIQPVLNLATERVASSTTGIWTGVAPDGSLLAIRDLSTQEIYSAELRRD